MFFSRNRFVQLSHDDREMEAGGSWRITWIHRLWRSPLQTPPQSPDYAPVLVLPSTHTAPATSRTSTRHNTQTTRLYTRWLSSAQSPYIRQPPPLLLHLPEPLSRAASPQSPLTRSPRAHQPSPPSSGHSS